MKKDFVVNDVNYSFILSSKGNKCGFIHKATLYEGERELTSRQVQYYNRTWEEYQFQAVMKLVVEKALKLIYRSQLFVKDFKTAITNLGALKAQL